MCSTYLLAYIASDMYSKTTKVQSSVHKTLHKLLTYSRRSLKPVASNKVHKMFLQFSTRSQATKTTSSGFKSHPVFVRMMFSLSLPLCSKGALNKHRLNPFYLYKCKELKEYRQSVASSSYRIQQLVNSHFQLYVIVVGYQPVQLQDIVVGYQPVLAI